MLWNLNNECYGAEITRYYVKELAVDSGPRNRLNKKCSLISHVKITKPIQTYPTRQIESPFICLYILLWICLSRSIFTKFWQTYKNNIKQVTTNLAGPHKIPECFSSQWNTKQLRQLFLNVLKILPTSYFGYFGYVWPLLSKRILPTCRNWRLSACQK